MSVFRAMWVAAVLGIPIIQGAIAREPYVPVKWTKFVPVEGQPLPVPEQWLDTEEARIAHNLKLPDGVPKPVQFDFTAAGAGSLFTSDRKVAVKYFDHLCRTEAGEWIFKTIKDVEGLYFARPQAPLTSDRLADLYGPEMPWIQREFLLTGDSLHWQGAWFVEPPTRNFRYVEQPHRDVKWQSAIAEPYIRLHGYTREALPVPGVYGKAYDQSSWYSYRDKTPMRADGITKPTARYGYTWRGLKRTKDREHGIAGGELLIYDLMTKEVLAVRRQFLITGRNPRGLGDAVWEVAARCPQLRTANNGGIEFSQFAFDVLQTIEPSTTGRK